MLMMLRFLIPIVALGLPPLIHLISMTLRRRGLRPLVRLMQVGLFALFLLGYPVLMPSYASLQGVVENEFYYADRVGEIYQNGSIVCDVPSMVYRLVDHWEVEPSSIISNLYSPHYYGIEDPDAYLEWLNARDIRVWIYFGGRGDPVWAVLEKNYPGVLVTYYGIPGRGVYLVNHGLLDSLL